MKTVCFAWFLVGCLLTQGCNKKEKVTPKTQELQLPAETQTGKNTLGCKINGAVWLPYGDQFGGPLLSADRSVVNGDYLLLISAHNRRAPFQQAFSFQLHDIHSAGKYTLRNGRPYSMVFIDQVTNCDYDTLSSQQSGTVDITRFDPVARVVSGRFEFTLQQAGCPDIKATEGRFDVKY